RRRRYRPGDRQLQPSDLPAAARPVPARPLHARHDPERRRRHPSSTHQRQPHHPAPRSDPRASMSRRRKPTATPSLMTLLTDPVRLRRAARACTRATGAPGPDGISWAIYRDGLDQHITDLAARLAAGVWQPGPCRLAALDAGDKTITIAIPNVEDRIV